MTPSFRLGVIVALTLATASCLQDVAPRDLPGPGVNIAVAALDLPAVGDVVWDLEVANGGGQIVWQRRVTSSGYGDGAGSASYLGPCDAADDVKVNTVRVWVVGVYADPIGAADAGSFASGATTGAGTVTGGTLLDFESPTASAALSRTFTCLANVDVAVRFDVTLMRPAAQGFFDIAMSFNDLFCSAKYDCCYDTGDDVCDSAEDILLLFDADGQRGRTHVLGFACTAGPAGLASPEGGVLTRLYMNDLAIDCSTPNTPPFAADLTVDVGPATAGNLCTAGDIAGCAAVTAADGVNADDYLFQVAVYRGAEDLTSGGVSARKVYWNVALGVNDLTGCRLLTGATADDHANLLDGLTGGAIADGAVYPYVQWDVNLGTCASEALAFGAATGPVLPSYATGTGDGANFASFYDATHGAGAACSAGTCGCLVGYPGVACVPAGPAPAPLALSPLLPAVSFSGTTAFSATGGAGGYVFSLTSGTGSIDPTTGLYTAPTGVADSVVRVTDAAGAFVETTISACADRTVTVNTSLPAGDYCYGTLTVNSPAVLTLNGVGVNVRAGHVAIASGASTTIALDATLNLTTLALPGTLTNNGTLGAATTLTLSGTGSYHHGAAAVLNAATAALSVPSGTATWNVSWGNAVLPLVGSATIAAGATLTHGTNTDTFANTGTYERSLRLATAGDVTVLGTINVNGKGYVGAKGPGAGVGNPTQIAASGGGHGGVGGTGGSPACTSSVPGGAANGDPVAPTGLGSGGGNSVSGYGSLQGGPGGGAVQLQVGGTLTVDGAIRANGTAGTPGGYTSSAGGAGGTVEIDATAFAGAGVVEALGGAGAIGSMASCHSGSGGGGRVAINANASPFTGTYGLGAGTGTQPGGSGTRALAFGGAYDIWNFALGVSGAQSWTSLTVASNASVVVQPGGTLTLDSLQLGGAVTNSGTLILGTTFALAGGARYYHTAVGVLQADAAALTVTAGTAATWDVDVAVVDAPRVASVAITAGATLTHSANATTHSRSLRLAAVGGVTVDGAIDVTGKGYIGAQGPGPGSGNANQVAASGGGHGGAGGTGGSAACSWVVAGGAANGDPGAPSGIGSGGGNSVSGYGTLAGGLGGGAVHLIVGGTLAVSGAVRAGGTAGIAGGYTSTGGGAGGAVWVDAVGLAGAGTVTAIGGAATQAGMGTSCPSGAGSGGRVALHVTTNTSTIVPSAAGGVAYNSGGGVVAAVHQGGAGTVVGP